MAEFSHHHPKLVGGKPQRFRSAGARESCTKPTSPARRSAGRPKVVHERQFQPDDLDRSLPHSVSLACLTMRTTKQRDWAALSLLLLRKIVSRAAARLILLVTGGFWGLVLIGVAVWLSKHGSPGAALACLAFSGAYFWFAWVSYHDPHQ
jgi:hypothetical protein